jgi:glycolate oxidase iron-sulfur subunit
MDSKESMTGIADSGSLDISRKSRVAVLLGCVQEGLFRRINSATVRVLEANGYEVVTVEGQDCCGALHAHGGDLESARTLARSNIRAFEASGADLIAVNAAGCGATMKDYGILLEEDPDFAQRAKEVASSVRDVSEILDSSGLRTGASVPCKIAYDHPCHLLHAQGVEHAPITVLKAVPDAEVHVVAGAEECCGGAGIYGITHPELGGLIGGDKVSAVRACSADAVATPNPGCMMQIGAGLRLEASNEGVIHPVELLDESYRRAGFYRAGGAE